MTLNDESSYLTTFVIPCGLLLLKKLQSPQHLKSLEGYGTGNIEGLGSDMLLFDDIVVFEVEKSISNHDTKLTGVVLKEFD